MNRRSRRLKIIKMFERPVTRLKLFNKDCQSMRLIRKLALPKQKHPPPQSLVFGHQGGRSSSGRRRGSVFRTHNRGRGRARRWLRRPAGGSAAAGRAGAGSGPVSTPARAPPGLVLLHAAAAGGSPPRACDFAPSLCPPRSSPTTKGSRGRAGWASPGQRRG